MKKIFYLLIILLTSIILCGCLNEFNKTQNGVTLKYRLIDNEYALETIDIDDLYYRKNQIKATVIIPSYYKGKPVSTINLDTMFGIYYYVGKIKLGKNIKKISLHYSSFPDLMEVSVSLNNHFVSIDGALYTKDKKELILWPNAKTFDFVVLPQELEKIHDYACAYNNIKNLTIPSSINTIYNRAFYESKQLEKVIFEDNSQLSRMDEYAFADSKTLTEVILPNNCNLKEISIETFSNCVKLNKINIPNSVTRIHRNAFSDCSQLETVTINEESNLEEIHAWAFEECKIESIYLPKNLFFIGTCAFSYCKKLKSIEIPDSITRLDSSVFSGCSSLEYAILPKNLENVPGNTFDECTKLTTVVLPESIVHIGSSAFDRCDNLKKIIFLGTMEQWNNISISSDNDILTSGNIEISVQTN